MSKIKNIEDTLNNYDNDINFVQNLKIFKS